MSAPVRKTGQEPEPNKWIEYERRKGQISQDLSPAERDREIKRIADELGI
jgi:hypothetical protein